MKKLLSIRLKRKHKRRAKPSSRESIQFLGNLVSGIKQGFQNFVGNIWEHLKKGLLGWLTGTMAKAGIQMPESFDLKGIFTLVMQVLGLAYDSIKSRTIKALGKNGEKMFNGLEKTFEIFVILKNEGLAGLWQFIQDKIGDLKVMVVDTIQNFVIESVIKQGVLWVISLLNPASAFAKACKMIYDIIMFFIERGSQIVELVNAVMEEVNFEQLTTHETFTTEIVQIYSDNVCPACGIVSGKIGSGGTFSGSPGERKPHNVVSASVFGNTIEQVLQNYGVTVLDKWAKRIISFGTSTDFSAVTEDLQCTSCEDQQGAWTLQQRAGGKAPVGNQFQYATPAQIEQFTKDKIQQVVKDIGNYLRLRAGTQDRPTSSDIYIQIVAPGKVDNFLNDLTTELEKAAK